MKFSLTKSFPFIHATGELPATQPIPHEKKSETEGLSIRSIQSDPLGDWFLSVPDKLPPKQISSILRQALAGNLWQQTQLCQRMLDSWPMFRKCCFELRAAVASAKFVVHPYSLPGEKPTDSAEEKADLVRRAMESFKPDRFADEDGFNGMIFDLTDAVINGISIVELLWNENAVDPQGRREKNIRASGWVHPRNLAFTPDGRIGVAYAAESGSMSFSNQVRNDLMDDPAKFLVARFKSKSGSALGAGFMRTLASLWVMVVYGRDFALNFAQKYGNPFLDLAYTAGLANNQTEVNKFEALAKQAANQGYFVHPDSAKLIIGPEHKMGGDNAQMTLMRFADEQCQLLMLGQTLTTNVADSGSRALGDVHENVRAEKLEEITKWIARTILTEQFAETLLMENFGETSERPTIEPDLTRPLSATEQADFLQKISNSRVPVMTDEIYKRAGLQQPSPGDKILSGGQTLVMEEAVTATEHADQEMERQMAMSVMNSGIAGTKKVFGSKFIQAALQKADATDIAELEDLVAAAERAPHFNGEAKAVEKKIEEIVTKASRK